MPEAVVPSALEEELSPLRHVLDRLVGQEVPRANAAKGAADLIQQRRQRDEVNAYLAAATPLAGDASAAPLRESSESSQTSQG